MRLNYPETAAVVVLTAAEVRHWRTLIDLRKKEELKTGQHLNEFKRRRMRAEVVVEREQRKEGKSQSTAVTLTVVQLWPIDRMHLIGCQR